MKRSSQVALLLMGTASIGSAAYSFMPSENCTTDRPGISSTGPQQSAECARRSGSSSSSSHRAYGGSSSSSGHSLFGSDSSSNRSTSFDSVNHSTTTRGGFGSFAHSFTSHFSGGG